ncbi:MULTISPECIES: hypothetical protein [unclassified Polaromonas]|uniref:hypothetical protein n=1 Tax=unclassified Polaromonas TaxID=2638319 RepID=UPI000F0895DF|nr:MULTISPECIES: hypothetical protein [unclassified Polaromonas]AYQ29239.1 hypothetical protein DT070_15135 [Polaromonas sp. SP1]QGJ19647.1 hypothetical protein F7R28_15465 [Polaromonas sp. Pch-P]
MSFISTIKLLAPGKLILAFFLLVALRAAHSQEQVVPAESLRVGDSVSGAVKYGRRIITLPAGTWRLTTYKERDSSTSGGGATMLDASFDEIVDGRLDRLLLISATKYSRNLNWIDEPCKTKGDAYWIDDRKRGFNDQFCIRVGYLSGVVDGARGEDYQTWARNIVAQGIKYSPDMPFVTVTKYTNYDFLAMRIAFNPEPYGTARSKRPERTFNDWNPSSVSLGTERKKIYEALKDWAPAYAAAVSRAFDGDAGLSSKDFGEPSLEKAP